MNLDRLAERAWQTFWRPSFTFTRYFFHPENDFSGFLDPQNLGKDTKFITPRQMQTELYWM